MSLKGVTRSARDVGRQLGVQFVLEGSVRKAGTNLRITAQLVEAESETQLLAEKYAGTIDDVFNVQERVSREIVRALGVRLGVHDERMITEWPIVDVGAYDCYLRARHELAHASPESVMRAQSLLRRGLDDAPENSKLRATLAFAKLLQMRMYGLLDVALLDEIAAEADDILRHDARSADAHFVRGSVAYVPSSIGSMARQRPASVPCSVAWNSRRRA